MEDGTRYFNRWYAHIYDKYTDSINSYRYRFYRLSILFFLRKYDFLFFYTLWKESNDDKIHDLYLRLSFEWSSIIIRRLEIIYLYIHCISEKSSSVSISYEMIMHIHHTENLIYEKYQWDWKQLFIFFKLPSFILVSENLSTMIDWFFTSNFTNIFQREDDNTEN